VPAQQHAQRVDLIPVPLGVGQTWLECGIKQTRDARCVHLLSLDTPEGLAAQSVIVAEESPERTPPSKGGAVSIFLFTLQRFGWRDWRGSLLIG
jgi:hypothetical protein